MTITFFSNFLNHHQLPFSLEMLKMKDVDYKFVATEKIPEERIKLGYEDMNNKYDFVVRSYENPSEAMRLGKESDVVIIGDAPKKYILDRIKANKLTFRYSERIFKSGFDLRTWLSLIKNYPIRERNVYLLCSSAYSAYDFNSAFSFKNKTLKWGYFPKTYEYDITDLLKKKLNNKTLEILWVGRFLNWKHPEKAIYVSKKLKELNIPFSMKMIGIGEEFANIKKMIIDNDLNKEVMLIGSVPTDKVREYMEKANIFLFTSDYNEGWGAVLNEAMNSGCTVVASHAIGAVPFMICNMENGIIYENDSNDDLITKIVKVVRDKDLQYKLGYNAYYSIIKTWNAYNAVKELIKFIEGINNHKLIEIKDGPCSKALPISNKKMYNYLMRNEK